MRFLAIFGGFSFGHTCGLTNLDRASFEGNVFCFFGFWGGGFCQKEAAKRSLRVPGFVDIRSKDASKQCSHLERLQNPLVLY